MRATLLFLSCLLVPASLLRGAEASFIRGDANADGAVDISDGVKVLNVLFLGEPAEDCDDASDANDDGGLDISDGVSILNFLFLGGAAPPSPYPGCGADGTADALDCVGYPLCAADCLDEADLDALLAEQLGASQCVPAGEVTGTFGTLTLTVCPVASAPPCGDPGAVGCPIQITTIDGTLDLPGRTMTIHIEGGLDDLPILVENSFPPSQTTCRNDIAFSGDAVLPFTATPNGDGTLTLTDLGDPVILDPVVTLDSSGGLLCDLLESQQDAFVDELIAQLQEAAAQLVADLEPELVGQALCAP